MSEEKCECCEQEFSNHDYEHLADKCLPIQIKRLKQQNEKMRKALEKVQAWSSIEINGKKLGLGFVEEALKEGGNND